MSIEEELEIAKELQVELMRQLENLETKTDLEGTAIISKTGIRIASSDTASTVADIFSASPATLVSLGINISKGLNQGELRDIVIRGVEGFTIITTSSQESNFMLITHSKKEASLGYYFNKINKSYREIEKLLKDVKLKSAFY